MREEGWRAQLPEYVCSFSWLVFISVPWRLSSPPFYPGPGEPLFLFSRETTPGDKKGQRRVKKKI